MKTIYARALATGLWHISTATRHGWADTACGLKNIEIGSSGTACAVAHHQPEKNFCGGCGAAR